MSFSRQPQRTSIGQHEEAVLWFQREIEAGRDQSSRPLQSRSGAGSGGIDLRRRGPSPQPGLLLNPQFTVTQYPLANLPHGANIQAYLAGRKRIADGMRKAGVPEE